MVKNLEGCTTKSPVMHRIAIMYNEGSMRPRALDKGRGIEVLDAVG